MGRKIDPAATPTPKALAGEGRRLELGLGHWKWAKQVDKELRDALVTGIKAVGNVSAYGKLLQTIEIDLPAGKTEEVTLRRDGDPLRRTVQVPEEDAALTCVPLGTLVAASGRLLLARLHKAVRERGGVMALWDTDSGHIVA